jgi:hypothetical protein
VAGIVDLGSLLFQILKHTHHVVTFFLSTRKVTETLLTTGLSF